MSLFLFGFFFIWILQFCLYFSLNKIFTKKKNLLTPKPNFHNFYKHIFRSSVLFIFLHFFNGEIDEVGYRTLMEVTSGDRMSSFKSRVDKVKMSLTIDGFTINCSIIYHVAPLWERERERGACVWESKLNKKNKRGRERETWGCSVEEKN